VLKRLWQRWRERRRHAGLRAQAARGPWRVSDPLKMIWLDPALVQLHSNYQPAGERRELRNRVFGPEVLPGSVVGGDWDLDCEPFASLEAYKAIHARIHAGTDWRETGYFAESMRDIEAGRTLWGCRSAEELDQRFAYIDTVIASIRRDGLRLQSQVGRAQDATGRYSDEIELNIGRRGQWLFHDGRHRLCIIKALGLSQAPFKIRARHEKWQRLREQVLALAAASPDGRLPEPAPHPDFEDIPFDALAATRLAGLSPWCEGPARRVLVWGAGLGAAAHRFATAGHAVSVQAEEPWLGPLKQLADAAGVHLDVLDPNASQPSEQRFALGLLLNPVAPATTADLRPWLLPGRVERWLIARPDGRWPSPWAPLLEDAARIWRCEPYSRTDLVLCTPDGGT
jgi:hypothetical protein